MVDENLFSIDLEKYPTKSVSDGHENGTLTVVWRNWDKIIKNDPEMVYVSSVNKGEIKGPHIHTERNSYFVCIHGKVVFVIKDEKGNYVEIESDSEKPKLIVVPKKFASAHINVANELSRVLVLADIAWRPNDNEMVNIEFDDYDWNKWKKLI